LTKLRQKETHLITSFRRPTINHSILISFLWSRHSRESGNPPCYIANLPVAGRLDSRSGREWRMHERR